MNNTVYADQDAERCVIGAMLQDASCQAMLDELGAEDFTDGAMGIVFGVMKRMRAKRQGIDIATVGSELGSQLEQVPVSVLLEAVRRVPSTANAKHYLATVKERTRRRALRDTCQRTLAMLGECDADEAVDIAMNELRGMIGGKSQWVPMVQVLSRTFEMLEDISNGKQRVISTPLPDLNNALAGGLRNGELTILAAGTGQGKSALALEIARHAARQGYTVGLVSREMGAEQYGMRAYAALAGVSTGEQLNAKRLTPEQWEKIGDATNDASALPLHFTFTASTVEDVRREAQRMKLDLLVVDYIQILGAKGAYASEHLRVSHISRMLKEIALDMGIPVLALSQFKRPVGGQAGKPSLSDLKESGSLENDADNVWLVSRPKDDADEAIPHGYQGWVEAAENFGHRFLLLEIAKQRMYSPGTIGICFNPERMSFYTPMK